MSITAPTVDAVEARLGRFRPHRILGARFMKRAAVAAVVREGGDGAEVLLIQRAKREGDPWSGHMAFPGGRVQGSDGSPRAAARRETREEVGLALSQTARPIGRLSDVLATAGGKPLPLVISPYVYALRDGERDDVDGFEPNDEVDSVVWVPLGYFADAANREEMEWRVGSVSFDLPCYRYQGRLVWGLTLEMLDELFERMGWLRGVVLPRAQRRRRWLLRLLLRGALPALKRALRLRPPWERRNGPERRRS